MAKRILARHRDVRPGGSFFWEAKLRANRWYIILRIHEKKGRDLVVSTFSQPFQGEDYQQNLEYLGIHPGDRLEVRRIKCKNGKQNILTDSFEKKCPNCHGDGKLTLYGRPAPPEKSEPCEPCSGTGKVVIEIAKVQASA